MVTECVGGLFGTEPRLWRWKISRIVAEASRELGYPILKPEQLDIMVTFVEGRDFFLYSTNLLWKELVLLRFALHFRLDSQERAWVFYCCCSDSPCGDHEGSGRLNKRIAIVCETCYSNYSP